MKIRFINSENLHSVRAKLENINWSISILVAEEYSHYWELDLNAKIASMVEKNNSYEYQTYELNRNEIDNILLID